jgi:hypothetical protein
MMLEEFERLDVPGNAVALEFVRLAIVDEPFVRAQPPMLHPAYDDVFAFHRAAARIEVIENRLRTGQQAPGFGAESDKDVHVERGHGFKIEGRAHRAADGVALDDAIGLHLIYRRDGVSDVHVLEFGSAAISRRAFNRNLLAQPLEDG